MGKRINYIDALRGIAIILVVFVHLYSKPKDIIPSYCMLFNDYFSYIRMPLFFFISGFFIYSEKYNFNLLRNRLINRIKCQLYPTIIIGLIFCIIFCKANFIRMLFETYKFGYWFTIVSVEMFVFTAPLLYLFYIHEYSKIKIAFILLSIGLILKLCSAIIIATNSLDNPYLGIVCAYQFSFFYIFLVAGIIFKMLYYNLKDILINKYLLGLNFVLFLLLVTSLNKLTSYMPKMGILIGMLISFIGIIAIINIFNFLYNKTSFIKTKAASNLELIGRNTLEIYLIHYFIIEIIGKSHLLTQILGIICGKMIEIPIFLCVSIVISYACLAIVQFLNLCNIKIYIFPKISKEYLSNKINYKDIYR